jgi:two-component system chemotaxis sensor kinase CheA
MADNSMDEVWSEWEDLFLQARTHLESLKGTPPNHVVQQAINALFRSTHTLKGMAGMLGYPAFGRAAHRLEDLFDLVRKGKLRSTDSLVETLEAGVMALEAGFLDLRRGRPEPDDYLRKVRGPIGDLEALAKLGSGEKIDLTSLLDLPEAIRKGMSDLERTRATLCLQDGIPIHALELALDYATFDEVLRAATTGLARQGELLSTLPQDLPDLPDRLGFILLVAAKTLSLEALGLADDVLRGLRLVGDPARVPKPKTPAAAPAPEVSEASVAAETISAQTTSWTQESEVIRLPAERLETLEGEIEELLQLRSELARRMRSAEVEDESAWSFQEAMLDRMLGLQRSLIQMRMVKVQTFFDRLDPMIKSLSRELGKPIKLAFAGGELELERSLVSKLIEPFIHLIRNAFDHGLESPEERKAQGKAEQGSIRISAIQKGRVLRFDIRDDGKGFDLERIRAKAIGVGLMREGEEATPDRLHRMVFEPGFSTREEASEISGRGVGMDVVRSEIEALGGEVYLHSEWKRGSLVRLSFPLAKAIVGCLKVRAGGFQYGIPLGSVVRVQLLDRPTRGGERVMVLGRELTFESLQACLSQPDPLEGQKVAVVVAVNASSAAQGIELAVGVDAILERGEVLFRGLPEFAQASGLLGVGSEDQGLIWGLDPEGLVGLGMESLMRRVAHA